MYNTYTKKYTIKDLHSYNLILRTNDHNLILQFGLLSNGFEHQNHTSKEEEEKKKILSIPLLVPFSFIVPLTAQVHEDKIQEQITPKGNSSSTILYDTHFTSFPCDLGLDLWVLVWVVP